MTRQFDDANAVRPVSVCTTDTTDTVINWLDALQRLAARLCHSQCPDGLLMHLMTCRSADLAVQSRAVIRGEHVDASIVLTLGAGLTRRRWVLPVEAVSVVRLNLMAQAGGDPEAVTIAQLLGQGVAEAMFRIENVHALQRTALQRGAAQGAPRP